LNRPFYSLYLRLMQANLALRQRLFQIWLGRRKADLAQADLSYLDLRGTNLSGGDLREANLAFCDLRGIDFSDADLTGANLQGALLTGDQLDQAGSLAGATMPNGAVHP
jgi:uncharacterized protein YjbI with pentapeptide repeats